MTHRYFKFQVLQELLLHLDVIAYSTKKADLCRIANYMVEFLYGNICHIKPKPRQEETLVNKAQLLATVDKITDDSISAKDIATVTDAVLSTIVRSVAKGESVTITGFGVFEKRQRAARVARNPRTGQPVKVRPTKVPAFRAAEGFKAEVKKGRPAATGSLIQRTVTKDAAPAKKVAKAPAKKAAPVKVAPAKKVAVKKAAPVKAVPAKKVAVNKAVAKKAASKAPAKTAVKKAAPAKVVAKKAPAKKVSKAPAKKAAPAKVAKKATAKK